MGLNICTFKLVKALGFSKHIIDPRWDITIKAYDEDEYSTKGMVVLPIRVGHLQWDIIYQVLDISLDYNILLGHPWIHDMQAVPSTYHFCIKFPHDIIEITILANSACSPNSPK